MFRYLLLHLLLRIVSAQNVSTGDVAQNDVLSCVSDLPDAKGNITLLLSNIDRCQVNKTLVKMLEEPMNRTCLPAPNITLYFSTNALATCGKELGTCVSTAKTNKSMPIRETFAEVTRCLSASYICSSTKLLNVTGNNENSQVVISARNSSNYFALLYLAFTKKQTCANNSTTCVASLGCGLASTAGSWFALDSLKILDIPTTTTSTIASTVTSTATHTVKPTPVSITTASASRTTSVPPEKMTDTPWDPFST